MPPRPAQGPRMLLKHQKLLVSLASAPSLSLFENEVEAILALRESLVARGGDKSVLRQQIRGNQLVQLLCAATARAVQLLQEKCSDLAAGVQLPAACRTAFASIGVIYVILQYTLIEGAKMWRYEYEEESGAAAPPDIIAARRQMEQELVQSGLLRTLAAACAVLTNSILQQHRQQHQQQMPAALSSSAAAHLLGISMLVLQTWNRFPLVMARCSPLSDMLAPTVLQVAGLAIEVLCSSSTDLMEARRIVSGSSSPRSGSAFDSDGRGVRGSAAERQQRYDCPLIAASCSMSIITAAPGKATDSPLLRDDSVLKLLLVNLGCVAEVQHSKHKGIPPTTAAAAQGRASSSSSTSRGKGPQQKNSKQTSSQQQQQKPVPPYHQQLLLALGLCPSTAVLRSEQYIAVAKVDDSTAVVAACSLMAVFLKRAAGDEQPQASAREPLQQSSGSAGGRSGSSSGAAASQAASGTDSADITIERSRPNAHIWCPSSKLADASLLPAGLLQPVLLTLLELQLLVPVPHVMCSSILVMELLHSTLADELDAAAAASILQPVLQLLAPTVASCVQDETSLQAQQAVDGVERQGVRHSTKQFHEMVVNLSIQVPAPLLLSMLQEQPQLTLTVLEAALRGAAVGDPGGLWDVAAAEAGDDSTKSVERHQWKLACCGTNLLVFCGDYLAAHSTQPAGTDCGTNGGTSSGSILNSSKLLSVAVTCCKAISNAKSVLGFGGFDAVLLPAAVGVCIAVLQQALPAEAGAARSCSDASSSNPVGAFGSTAESRSSSYSSSSNAGSVSSSGVGSAEDPWCRVALAAQAIQLLGQLLATQAAAQPVEAEPDSTGHDYVEQPQLLRGLHTGLALLASHLSQTAAEMGLPGESAAAGTTQAAPQAASAATGAAVPAASSSAQQAALQQLGQQHAAVMQGLQTALDVFAKAATDELGGESAGPRTGGSGGAEGEAAAAGPSWGLGQVVGPVLARQLQELGAALCGQLPLPHFCNNPLCQNMNQCSELQLVGGKSCICGGCRTARYCGKECQLAHWKAHKPVCKRIKEAAAAAVTG